MPIQVTCSGCLSRFNVSDKFAGKTGSCPKCKAQIRVPDKTEEVVIHEPENYGPKDASGRAVLKPLERKEVRFTPAAIVAIIGTIVTAFAIAFILGRSYPDHQIPLWLLGAGALIMAPLVAWSGYACLRDDEMGAHSGSELILRVAICAVFYAALWGIYAIVSQQLLDGKSPELPQLVFLAPVFIAAGGGVALLALELDFGTGCLHYCFYLLVTILMRFVMGLPAV